jgi:hypothetical protein
MFLLLKHIFKKKGRQEEEQLQKLYILVPIILQYGVLLNVMVEWLTLLLRTWRSRVQISAQIQAILIEVVPSFPQSLQENAEIEP